MQPVGRTVAATTSIERAMRGHDHPLRHLTLMVDGPGPPVGVPTSSRLADLVPGVVTVGATDEETIRVAYDPTAADAWAISRGLERLGVRVLALLPCGFATPVRQAA